jgi:hypothetical protein
MAAPIFDFVSDELERRSELAKLEARGTVRLALKQGGLDAVHVTGDQMAVILQKVMPGELAARGIADADAICQGIASALAAERPDRAAGPSAESPEAIFRRLAES